MRYAARWDRTLRLSTAAAVIVIAALAFLASFVSRGGGGPGGVVSLLAALLLGAILAASWALGPKGFAVERGHVRIDRPLLSIAIPLSEVRSAGRIPDGALRGALRLAGSGGLFGYYGRFWSRRLGSFRTYATRMDGLVQLDTARGRFILSPDPPDRFVEEVLAHATRAVRSDPSAPSAPEPMPRRARIAVIAIVVAVPLAIGAIVLGMRAFAPRAVAVEEGEIRIERQLVGPVAIPLTEVREVEILSCQRRGRLWRVAGYSGPGGTSYGHFRSDTLGDVQLYAWRPGPYVLLETERGRIVVTPDDPEAFVAAVRAGIGAR